MNTTRQTRKFAAACGGALMLGISLRAFQAREELQVPAPAGAAAEKADKVATGAGAGPGSPSHRQMLVRRAVAKCDDASLWEFAQTMSNEADLREAVHDEIIDRMGWGAWEKVLAMEEGKGRNYLMPVILGELGDRDHWKAYEEWKLHRHDILDGDWGHAIAYPIVQAASAISAERLIEVLKEMPAEYWLGTEVEYAAGFDFRAVLDFAHALDEDKTCCLPDDLLLEWSKRSPGEAAAWWRAHAEYRLSTEEWPEVYAELAGSDLDAAERMAVLDAIEASHAKGEDRIWDMIGTMGAGKVDPALLDAARLSGREEDYLLAALFKTREVESMDASWLDVPLAQREKAKAAVEEKWAREHPGAINEQARERWGKMVEAAWGE